MFEQISVLAGVLAVTVASIIEILKKIAATTSKIGEFVAKFIGGTKTIYTSLVVGLGFSAVIKGLIEAGLLSVLIEEGYDVGAFAAFKWPFWLAAGLWAGFIASGGYSYVKNLFATAAPAVPAAPTAPIAAAPAKPAKPARV